MEFMILQGENVGKDARKHMGPHNEIDINIAKYGQPTSKLQWLASTSDWLLKRPLSKKNSNWRSMNRLASLNADAL